MRFILSALMLLSFLFMHDASAQGFVTDLEFGTVSEKIFPNNAQLFIGVVGGDYYFLSKHKKRTSRNGGKLYQIEKVFSDFQVEEIIVIELGSFDLIVEPVGSFIRDGQVYLLTLEQEKGQYLTKLVARKFDFDKFYRAPSHTLGMVNYKILDGAIGQNRFARKEGRQYFWIRELPDTTGFAVVYDLVGGKNQKERFGINYFDEQFNSLGTSEIELPVSEHEFELYDIQLDQKGDVFIIAKQYLEGRKEHINREINYKLKFYQFNKGKTEPEIEIDMKLDSIRITGFKLHVNNDQVYGCGFYGDVGKKIKTLGALVFSFNKTTQKLSDVNIQAFSRALKGVGFNIDQLSINEKLSFEKFNSFGGLTVDHFVPHPDGGCYVVAEGRVTVLYDSNRHEYNCNNIVIIRISQDGEIMWIKKIPRDLGNLNESSKNLGSYLFFVSENGLNLVFTEGGRAFFRNDDDDDFKYYLQAELMESSGRLVLVNLDYKDQLTKTVLLPKIKGYGFIDTHSFAEVKSGIVFYLSRKKTRRFGQLKILAK
jgi:hypothetical protein